VPFYNEIDPFPARWLQNLMDIDLIPEGEVDRRSIEDLRPEDTSPISHFFAGIGGWPYALRLAGWPDDRPVWTGSCPCQPFSTAGRGRGVEDERHLWPTWFRLIRERRPPTIFGEQVASLAGLAWLDSVSADLEGEGYAFGATDLCAASIGAPHIRQRLFFVAFANGERRKGIGLQPQSRGSRSAVTEARRSRETIRVVYASSERSGGNSRAVPRQEGKGEGERIDTRHFSNESQPASELGDASLSRSQGRSLPARSRDSERSPWSPSGTVWCRDGKWRDVEPDSFPLAHGVPGRVGRLRAYGNAIVPQLAAIFIRAACEAIEEMR